MPMSRRFPALTIALIMALLAIMPAAATHDGESHAFGDDTFWATWARTDEPVAAGQVSRTWMWGDVEPYTPRMSEQYAEGPGGMRTVQYFDKSRMEMNDPGGDRDSLWFVTNGLLVIEMVEGHLQIGDARFDPSPDPADIPIAGDPDSGSPTYADINAFGLRGVDARSPGTLIDEHLTMTGIESMPGYGEYGVTAETYVADTDHTVASVFWAFMTSVGIVFEPNLDTLGGEFAIDELFPNPYYATGFPITEAYWTTAMLRGQPTDILWQCFERRCLTYTPTNDPGWQVEAGNVGQHYYNWRYPFGEPTEEAVIYLVDIGNTRGVAEEFGCDDSLVPLTIPIPIVDTAEARIAATLQPLLALGETTGPLDVWYNALGTDLYVQSIALNNGAATINLVGQLTLGGVCDNPRVEEQLRATVLAFDDVNEVLFLLNGAPVFPITGQ
jgi:hypothetical protein